MLSPFVVAVTVRGGCEVEQRVELGVSVGEVLGHSGVGLVDLGPADGFMAGGQRLVGGGASGEGGGSCVEPGEQHPVLGVSDPGQRVGRQLVGHVTIMRCRCAMLA